jgi:raffinose/stachyose/melibiose transport system substrate-binding protein
MILQGSWGYPGIKTADPTFISSGKLGYTTFPTVTGGTGAPTDIVGNPANFWAVSSDADAGAQTAAQTYLKSGVLNEANIDALIAGGAVPPVTGLDAKIAKATDPHYLSWVYKLAEKAPGFQLSWDQAISPAAADALLTNLDQIFLKQISPQDFATAMNKTIGT